MDFPNTLEPPASFFFVFSLPFYGALKICFLQITCSGEVIVTGSEIYSPMATVVSDASKAEKIYPLFVQARHALLELMPGLENLSTVLSFFAGISNIMVLLKIKFPAKKEFLTLRRIERDFKMFKK